MVADFEPAAFLTVAQYLLEGLSGAPTVSSDRDQALVRASIGRSYCAAFLTARTKLLSLGRLHLTRGSWDHNLVIDALGGNAGGPGRRLHYLRKKRNQADYNLNPHGFTLSAGRLWLNEAEKAIDEINALV